METFSWRNQPWASQGTSPNGDVTTHCCCKARGTISCGIGPAWSLEPPVSFEFSTSWPSWHVLKMPIKEVWPNQNKIIRSDVNWYAHQVKQHLHGRFKSPQVWHLQTTWERLEFKYFALILRCTCTEFTLKHTVTTSRTRCLWQLPNLVGKELPELPDASLCGVSCVTPVVEGHCGKLVQETFNSSGCYLDVPLEVRINGLFHLLLNGVYCGL